MEANHEEGEITTWMLCNYCTRAFTSVDALVSHKMTIHPEKFQHSLPEPKKIKKQLATSSSSSKENLKSAKTDTLPTIKEKSSSSRSRNKTNKKPAPIPTRTSSRLSLSTKSSAPSSVTGDSPETTNLDSSVDNSSVEEVSNDDDGGTKESEAVNEPTPSQDESPKDTTTTEKPKFTLPPLPKEVANAFNVLIKSSLRLKESAKSATNTVKLRSSTRNSNHSTNSAPSEKKVFNCHLCQRQLESEDTLKLHLKMHESIVFNTNVEPPKIPCKLCKKILTTPPYNCTDCPAKEMVMDHPPVPIKQEPVEMNENVEEQENDEDMMDIDDDDVEATNKTSLSKQKTKKDEVENKNPQGENALTPVKTNVKVFNCGFCPKSFTDAAIFRAHHESTHTEDDVNSKDPGYLYNCKYCDRSFGHRGNRNIHQRSHEKVNNQKKKSPTKKPQPVVS